MGRSFLDCCPGPPPRADDRPALLTVSVTRADGYTLVTLDGEGDVTVRGQLCTALAAAAAPPAPRLVVDVSGLRFIDASCLGVLARAARATRDAGGSLRLAAAQPLVMRVIELCGARELVEVHDSVAQAGEPVIMDTDGRGKR